MGYVVLLLAVGVTIYALVDCWNSADDEVRGLPRLAWLPVILLLPAVGAVVYLLTGRDRSGTPRLSRPRVVAPDDDPDFLRQLDQQRRRAAADDRKREAAERKDREKREKTERREREKLENKEKNAEKNENKENPSSS